MTESAQAALSALRHLQPADRDAARTALGLWARRAELSEIEVDRVLNYYFTGDPQNATTRTAEPMVSAGARCYDSDPHEPHRTIFGPEMGIANFDCAGVPETPPASADFRDGFNKGYLAAATQSVRLRKGHAELAELREQLLACPDWCTDDHTHDDPADPVMNLILHMGDDHIDGVGRKLLNVGEGVGTKLDIRVARTDCPQEGTVGTPVLLVRADLELTTWEQAAELARAILDGFGYLAGAERN